MSIQNYAAMGVAQTGHSEPVKDGLCPGPSQMAGWSQAKDRSVAHRNAVAGSTEASLVRCAIKIADSIEAHAARQRPIAIPLAAGNPFEAVEYVVGPGSAR